MICVTEYSLRIIRALFSCIGICHRPGAIIDVGRITIDWNIFKCVNLPQLTRWMWV